MSIKNIIFDFGGVIVDIDRDAAVRQFKAAGIADIETYIDPYRQKGIFKDFEDGSVSREQFYEKLALIAGVPVDPEEIDRGWLDFLKKPVSQKKLDYISELRKNRKTMLLSNTNPIIMEWANSPQFSPSGKPLESYFDIMFLSYKMRCMKPDSRIYSQLVAAANINPEETLFIDDSRANIEAGAACGFRTLLFENDSDFFKIENLL
ncbi:MAG: HAD family phosphatase [Prevotellaceae bacterium]|jgi:putative hydrolase of the HAD superfamily|nr:HAD family phosphatase [Prevotellaceae bacterium]